jgi:hypothetical protein
VESKECCKCKKIKKLTEFAWRKKSAKRKQSWCKECHRKEDKDRYYNGPRKQQVVVLNQKYVNHLRELIRRYKLFVGCKNCGYKKNAKALDFHHIRGKKVMNVSSLVTFSKARNKVKAEIRKCKVLCSNCHREEHGKAP